MVSQKKHVALDIGSSQITCVVGNVTSTGFVHVHATGVQASAGIEKGIIVDMEKAVYAIKKTIEKTEKALGGSIQSVTVSSSGLNPKSHWVEEEISISSKKVKQVDLTKLLNICRSKVATEDTPIIHVIPYFYSIDGAEAKKPMGIHGKNLKASMHLITCQKYAFDNLKYLLERCSLEINNVVIDSLASSLGTMDEQEKDISSIVLDIGGGSSSWAIFYQGKFVYASSISLGGDHITSDIMHTISANNAEAERIKNTYGSAIILDNNTTLVSIDYYRIGEQDTMLYSVSRGEIISIINNRLNEIFDIVNAKITKFGFAKRLILTGGSANIENIRELATYKLQRNVRIAKSIQTIGLSLYDKTNMTTAIGLLRYACEIRPKEEKIILNQAQIYEGSLFSRLWHFIRHEI